MIAALSVASLVISALQNSEAGSPKSELAKLRGRFRRLGDVDVDALCLDHFQPVYDKFSKGMRRDEKINELLEYCYRNPGEQQRLERLLKRWPLS
jgi:hypothetical protein